MIPCASRGGVWCSSSALRAFCCVGSHAEVCAGFCHIPDENWVKMRNCNEPHSIIGCGMNGADRKLILWP